MRSPAPKQSHLCRLQVFHLSVSDRLVFFRIPSRRTTNLFRRCFEAYPNRCQTRPAGYQIKQWAFFLRFPKHCCKGFDRPLFQNIRRRRILPDYPVRLYQLSKIRILRLHRHSAHRIASCKPTVVSELNARQTSWYPQPKDGSFYCFCRESYPCLSAASAAGSHTLYKSIVLLATAQGKPFPQIKERSFHPRSRFP